MQPQELLKRLKSKQPPAILDVRSGFEFRAGHKPGAIHAPS
jgi:rhodanese-related sulfurtransferase